MSESGVLGSPPNGPGKVAEVSVAGLCGLHVARKMRGGNEDGRGPTGRGGRCGEARSGRHVRGPEPSPPEACTRQKFSKNLLSVNTAGRGGQRKQVV